jgi:hypothetical protein
VNETKKCESIPHHHGHKVKIRQQQTATWDMGFQIPLLKAEAARRGDYNVNNAINTGQQSNKKVTSRDE